MTAGKFGIGINWSPEYHPRRPAMIASANFGSVFAERSHPSNSCRAVFHRCCAVGAGHLSICCLSSPSWLHQGQLLTVRNRQRLIFFPCAKSPVANFVTHFHRRQVMSVIARRMASQSTCSAVPSPNLSFCFQYCRILAPLMCSRNVSVHCLIIFFASI